MSQAGRPDRMLGVMAVILALGCAWTARRGDPAYEVSRADAAALVHGEQVFTQHCQQCHGASRDRLAGSVAGHPPPWFPMQVRQGVGQMPAFTASQITDAELDDLLRYLQNLRRQRPFSWY